MLVKIAVAAALALVPLANKWELRPVVDDQKATWAVSVRANVMGQDHEAAFDLVRSVKREGPLLKSKTAWENVTIDGMPMPIDTDFEATHDPNMVIVTAGGEFGDDARRMMAPFIFVYPDAPVGVGDKWEAQWKSEEARASQLSYSFEVLEETKLGEVETLKVKSTMEEKATGGTRASGTWWVDRSGVVRQFELDVKLWIVPMAGTETVDALIKGSYKPRK
jgi:hypothetical protein